jgi:hypothetical protein
VVILFLELVECGLKVRSAREKSSQDRSSSRSLPKEALDVAVLPGFTRPDEAAFNPFGEGHGSELGTVVADDALRPAETNSA